MIPPRCCLDASEPVTMSVLTILQLFFVLVITACATAPATRYYQIQPAPAPVPATASEGNPSKAISIGIGPIRLPPYLDRSKIVLAQQDSEIKLAEYSEWAGPLDDNIGSVLARDIGALMGTEKVSRYPWPPETAVDYRIEIELIRLHAIANNEVVLEARWLIKDDARRVLTAQYSQFKAPIPAVAEELQGIVAAHGEVLRQLALAIANALYSLQT